jgi:sortase (surface protein transpeptidase)
MTTKQPALVRRLPILLAAAVALAIVQPIAALASVDGRVALTPPATPSVIRTAEAGDPETWTYDNVPGWTGWPHRVSAPRLAWAIPEVVTPPPPPAKAAPAKVSPAKATPAKTTVAPAPTKPAPAKVAPTYSGKNHLWIPALGVDRSVTGFACTASAYPGDRVYRWGCAGENNVYILGHASSVMKPLHDLYVRGDLRKGMIAVYANGNGTVTKYRVIEWRVVDPVDSHWAIADQPVPSMTLQTCVGKMSQWRLNVRLVAVDQLW